VLLGEAGIGKSRIVEAFRQLVSDESHVTLRYQCSPYHIDSALHPIIRQLEQAAGLAADNPPLVKLDKLEALLRRGTTSLEEARASDGSLARETLVVGGVEQPVEVERQERYLGGAQGYWLCPACSRRCCALFIVQNAPVGSVLACRKCHRLSHRSRVLQRHKAVLRVAKLRKKLGAEPSLLSPIPPRHPRWRRDYYARMVRQLAEQEAILVGMLGDIVHALKRRKGRLHGPR
jgi:hypothetical protein